MNPTMPLVGQLLLRPGHAQPIRCERPMVSASLMRRLTEGRHARLLPDLVAAVFTMGAQAQGSTTRRAVAAALGLGDSPATLEGEQLALRLSTAREHLQRLALDLPQQLPWSASDPTWLRDAPVFSLPARAQASDLTAFQHIDAALRPWLERRVLGMPADAWLARWNQSPEGWMHEWACRRGLALHGWWRAAAEACRGLQLPCRPLLLPPDPQPALREWAAAMATDPDFPERPLWQGRPAETGPWTRRGRSVAEQPALGVWHRLGARLADLAHIALGGSLDMGCLNLASGEGMAWCEMSRGLLVHWVRLDGPAGDIEQARVQAFRVLSPTEWNFHPEGALAQALRQRAFTNAQTRVVVAALDPCIRCDMADEAGASHA